MLRQQRRLIGTHLHLLLTSWTRAVPQSLLRCFANQLTAKQAQRIAHPPPPAADDSGWHPVPTAAGGVLQLGPRRSALCGDGTGDILAGQTLQGGRGQECCTGSADCEGRAAEYSFFDTRCAPLSALNATSAVSCTCRSGTHCWLMA